ncbi:hypothetical protein [Lacinutrix algicola]|uniref:hypothetical protein n=1 Tax=Lacinutrix algicola TaxID=342954 RepID=UPI0006E22292|nr:hypothetical protein [Lacinutrix algicola]
MISIILPIVIFTVFTLLFIVPLLKQKIKLFKDLKALEDQDKKLKEMTSKQNMDNKYIDFTDGHLYQ